MLGEKLHDVEIRAGFDDANEGKYPLSDINKHCYFYKGPGKTGETIICKCADGPIEAKYLTVQIIAAEPEWLQIREIDLIIDDCRGDLSGKYNIIAK